MFSETPKIQKFQFPEKSEVNEKASVTCSLKTGKPPFSFHWRKNGKEFEDGKGITTQTLKLLSILVIDPVTYSAAGNYTCIVRNSEGTDTFSSVLTVTGIYLFY